VTDDAKEVLTQLDDIQLGVGQVGLIVLRDRLGWEGMSRDR
jgi:hypothetical protein